jgi:HEPN domain-containing protein
MSELNIVDEWFRYSQNDLLVAKHCFEDMHPKQTVIASYHCQQCAEKSLKAFLISKNIEPPKTHDLKFLSKMCQDIDSLFVDIATQCARLDSYGSATRYPKELSPDENIVKRLINEAQQVYDFCLSRTNLK